MTTKTLGNYETIRRPSPFNVTRHLVSALAESEAWSGSPIYIGQDSNGGFFTTENENDMRAIRWIAKVEALPDPDNRF